MSLYCEFARCTSNARSFREKGDVIYVGQIRSQAIGFELINQSGKSHPESPCYQRNDDHIHAGLAALLCCSSSISSS